MQKKLSHNGTVFLTEERFDSGSYTTYYGKALAVVQAEDSEITVTVTDGVKTGTASIAVQ